MKTAVLLSTIVAGLLACATTGFAQDFGTYAQAWSDVRPAPDTSRYPFVPRNGFYPGAPSFGQLGSGTYGSSYAYVPRRGFYRGRGGAVTFGDYARANAFARSRGFGIPYEVSPSYDSPLQQAVH